ncbi:MAG: AGE family epimerase/isomerase [Paraglaciecola sp.]|nr:AGE family epimerase/isomerase [Paraglaciecola sp.]
MRPTFPDFNSKAFLTQHIADTLAFYEPNIDAPHGGFYQNFADDGSVFDKESRHLVSSTRFVFNYARAYLLFKDEKYLQRVKSGIEFLRNAHFNPKTRGYAWLLKVDEAGHIQILDDTNHCYGFAFVILAYSWACRAGVPEAKTYLAETFACMEQHFWDTKASLYKDQFNADFSVCDPYRGQNANMHSCEALIAAFEATQENHYLDRALLLADTMVNRQASMMNGLIWEHYDTNWNVDLNYNKDDPKHLFRPWGFQPGHQTEWAKLLLFIARHRPADWLLAKAEILFNQSINIAWDKQHGGCFYGFAPDHSICDDDKYFWVQAESLCCAAYLFNASGNPTYQIWYQELWRYSWQHMIDHKYGAWFRILTADNQKVDDKKSPLGKTDYHTMGACFDILQLGSI